MAERKLVIAIVGDSRSLEKSFARSSRSAQQFNTSIGKASRGALAGSGAFGGLGRSLAFASGAFLGGAGLVAGLKSSSAAASNLAEQTARSNVVFGQSAKVVQDYAKNALGLASDTALEATGTFGGLLRTLGATPAEAARTSIELTKLAVDMASLQNTTVPEALAAIQSGLVGEVEPLRRFNVRLSESRVQQLALATTGKKTVKALTDQEKTAARLAIIYKDSTLAQGDFARTSGGLANQQRTLQKNVRNLQIAIGTALNPTILDAVAGLNKWFQNTENQRKAVDAAKQSIEALKVVMGAIVGVAEHLAAAFRTFADLVGGNARAVKILVGAFVAFKALQMTAVAANVGRSLGLIGTGAAGATGKVNALRLALLRLGALGAIFLAIEFVINREKIQDEVQDFLRSHRLGFLAGRRIELPAGINPADLKKVRDETAKLKGENDLMVQALDKVLDKWREIGNVVADVQSRSTDIRDKIAGLAPRLPETTGAAAGGAVPKPPKGATVEQRNTWWDAMIGRRQDRVQDIANLRGQIAALRDIEAAISARIAATKDITRKLRLEDELLDVRRQRKGVQEQLLQDIAQQAEDEKQAAKDAAAKLKQAAEERARVAAAARDARQFKLLGLGPTGGAIVPGRANLLKRAGNLSDAIKGTFLDTGKTRGLLDRITKLLKDGTQKLSADVRSAIDGIITETNQKLNNAATGPATKYHKANVTKLLSGLGLSPDLIRELSGRISQISRGGTVPTTGVTGAFGMVAGAGGTTTIVTNVELDGWLVGRSVTKQQQKRARRNPTQKRGPWVH